MYSRFILRPIKFLWRKIKNTSLKKKILVVLILSAIFGVFYFQKSKSEEKGYIFDTVQRRTITEYVSESGNISTAGTTPIYSPSTGIIEEIYVKNGDLVGIDQALFKVKSTASEDDKAAAWATLAAAQSTLKTAEQTKLTLQASLETARKGVLDAQQDVDDKNTAVSEDPNTYTQNERDSYDSALTTARYTFNVNEKKYLEADVAIRSAQASVTKAALAYESTQDRTILSPTIGTVTNVSVSSGTAVQASSGDTSLSSLGLSAAVDPVLSIANFSSNEIILGLNEEDISKVNVGQVATITADAVDGQEYQGVVTRLDDIGHDNQGVIVYNVYIDILNADTKHKSGMTVDVDIVTHQKSDILTAPNAAIKPYQGGRALRILNKTTNEIEFVPIETGIRGDEYTEILSGVQEGDRFIESLTNDQIERTGPLGF